MKKILTVGVFDYFHYGHLRLFQKAKALGDHLIVAVQEGAFILRFKPEATVYYTTEQRLAMVGALRAVDAVCTYESIDSFIETVDFDVFAIGEDQNHEGFQRAVKWCEEHGKKSSGWNARQGLAHPTSKKHC